MFVALVLLGACSDAPPVSNVEASPGGETDVFFATSPHGPSGDQALYRGKLAVRDGCVFIGVPGDYSVPVWPKGFTSGTESDRLVVKDADGATVATEGQVFEMGGGYTAEFLPADKVEPREEQLQRVSSWLGYPIPDSCLGDGVYGVWVVGEIEPLAS